MRTFLLVLLVGALAVGKLSSQSATPPPGRTVTKAEYERWKIELTNWGRWGQDDEIGALNLITPAKRRQAAALVKEGFSVSLAGDVDTVQAVDNWYPYEHTMLTIGKDRIAVNYHGIAHSHVDSLAHMNANGVFYNGYTPDPETVLKEGHSKNSIHNVKNGGLNPSTQHFALKGGGGVYADEAKSSSRLHAGGTGGGVGSVETRGVAQVDWTSVW